MVLVAISVVIGMVMPAVVLPMVNLMGQAVAPIVAVTTLAYVVPARAIPPPNHVAQIIPTAVLADNTVAVLQELVRVRLVVETVVLVLVVHVVNQILMIPTANGKVTLLYL